MYNNILQASTIIFSFNRFLKFTLKQKRQTINAESAEDFVFKNLYEEFIYLILRQN